MACSKYPTKAWYGPPKPKHENMVFPAEKPHFSLAKILQYQILAVPCGLIDDAYPLFRIPNVLFGKTT